MTALYADGVRLVLIEKLDRLARDQDLQELILGDLKKYGFELVPVMEPDLVQDDPTNPTRKLLRQIMGAIAEYEKIFHRFEAAWCQGTHASERGPLQGREAIRLL
jgi:DNA invertase Pin-like site-specific DNA recombinase